MELKKSMLCFNKNNVAFKSKCIVSMKDSKEWGKVVRHNIITAKKLNIILKAKCLMLVWHSKSGNM